MKHLIISLYFLFHISNIYCQSLSIQWQECFGGSEYDEARDVIIDDLGNTYFLGFTRSTDGDISFSHGGDDVWLVKTDPEGNLIWEKTFGGSNGEVGEKILKMESGDIILVNVSQSSDGDISNDKYDWFDIWITRIDTSGQIVWDGIFGGNDYDEPRDAIITKDGNILVSGLTLSNDGDISNYYGSWDVWIIEVDTNGNLNWELTLGSPKFEDVGAVIETSDNGYIVVASTAADTGGNCNCENHYPGYLDAWIIKLDSLRNIEWQKCYGGRYDEWIKDIVEVNDGYICVGGTTSNDGDVSGYHGVLGDINTKDIWVVKTDKQGDMIWQKCLGGSKNESSRIIQLTDDSTYMIIGETQSGDGNVSGHHPANGIGTTYDIWMVELNEEGAIIWQQCIGGSQDETVYHGVVYNGDKNYIIAGNSDRPADGDVQCEFHGGTTSDFWVFELNDSATGIADRAFDEGKIIAYPNPAEDHVVFEWEGSIVVHQIKIFDLYGRLTGYLEPGKLKNKITWNCISMPPGLYLYQVYTADRLISDKIIIQK